MLVGSNLNSPWFVRLVELVQVSLNGQDFTREGPFFLAFDQRLVHVSSVVVSSRAVRCLGTSTGKRAAET